VRLASRYLLQVGGVLLCLWGLLAPARAETLSALGGLSESDDYSASTYAWALEYREAIGSHYALSLEWLNEGHTEADRRDGAVAQFWFDAPRWFNRVTFSLGAGPYIYFDTETTVTAKGYSDDHGIGGVFSGAMRVDLGHHWVATAKISDLYTPGTIGTYHLMIGAGYDFTDLDHLLSTVAKPSGEPDIDAPQQVQVFGGPTIFNTRDSRDTYTFGVDYRFQVNHWSDLSATWFHDLSGYSGLKNRLAAQVWAVDRIERANLSLGIGMGGYVDLGPQPDSSAVPFERFAGLSGIRADWQFLAHTSVVLTWYRKFTEDDADRDILTLGLARSF
jgi:hypothetical protein